MAGRFAWVTLAGAAALLAGCGWGRPEPGFTFSPESGTAPLSVQFTNTSTGGGPFAVAWSWDFGDSSPAETAKNPVHVYAVAGDFPVTLTMKSWCGERSVVGGPVVVTTVPGPVPVFTVDFSASPTVGAAPLTTRFTNETTFSAKCDAVWSWDFGDGSAPSAEMSPDHVYTVPGSYTVRLTALAGSVERTKEKAGYVVVTETPDPGAGPVLERTVTPAAYTPGAAVTVTLRILYTGTGEITALGIQETLPDGWTYAGFSGGGTPPVSPQIGDGGTLDFAYITVPGFPAAFSYLALPPVSASGTALFSGQVLYRTSGGEQVSQPCVTETLPAGGGEGEGEGEGEPALTQVPDLLDRPVEEVAGLLADSGLVQGGISAVWSETVDIGRVVAQDPAAGAMVPVGSAVTVSLSEYAQATLLHLSRSSDATAGYVQGGLASVTVTLDRTGAKPVTQLDVSETLPAGWTYAGWLDGEPPDSAPLPGDTPSLAFSWEAPLAFPLTFSYLLNVPADAAGTAQLSGKALYEAGNGMLESNTETTLLFPPGTGGLVLDRSIGGQGVWRQGEPVEVTLNISAVGGFTGTVTAFGLEEELPAGWAFGGMVSAPTVPTGAGVPEGTSTLGILWITPPPLPVTVVYRLVPGGDGPLACLQGDAIYRVGSGGERRSNTEVSCLSEGLAP